MTNFQSPNISEHNDLSFCVYFKIVASLQKKNTELSNLQQSNLTYNNFDSLGFNLGILYCLSLGVMQTIGI